MLLFNISVGVSLYFVLVLGFFNFLFLYYLSQVYCSKMFLSKFSFDLHANGIKKKKPMNDVFTIVK